MKKTFLNDLNIIRKNHYKYILIHLFLLLIFLVVYGITKSNFRISFYTTLGLNFSKNATTIEQTLYLYNSFVYIFLFVFLFLKNLSLSVNNLFLRENKKTWCFRKLILNYLYIIIFKAISY
ncbi:MAG: hypothetical protein RR623_06020, partial [Bacilli bacterium]